jgi:hypothetical protein
VRQLFFQPVGNAAAIEAVLQAPIPSWYMMLSGIVALLAAGG